MHSRLLKETVKASVKLLPDWQTREYRWIRDFLKFRSNYSIKNLLICQCYSTGKTFIHEKVHNELCKKPGSRMQRLTIVCQYAKYSYSRAIPPTSCSGCHLSTSEQDIHDR